MDEWVGWMHDRRNWDLVPNREAVARAHNLGPGPSGWEPWRDISQDDGPYETEEMAEERTDR